VQGPLTLQSCDTAVGYQQWHLMNATLSGVPGMCMTVDDDGADSSPYTIEPCGDGYQRGFGLVRQMHASAIVRRGGTHTGARPGQEAR
jgi:hypothetical protein